jgi:osmotically-inducible protein OsmY
MVSCGSAALPRPNKTVDKAVSIAKTTEGVKSVKNDVKVQN